jgi:plastocyanin
MEASKGGHMAKRSRRHSKRTAKRRWKTGRIVGWVTLSGIFVMIAVLGFFAFSGGEEEAHSRVRQVPVVTDEGQVTVDVEDNYFEPNDLTVRAGAEVTWKFKGDAAHDVTGDGGAFESGTMTSGDEYILTFDEPGTYSYYCTLHHVMQGTLTVRP